MFHVTLPITILTGPAAAGKNTIADIYATRFCKCCAVIDVDVIRGMLRQPHVAPWEGTEGLVQHRLGVKHACMLARSFQAEGYDTVLLDVIWADLGRYYHEQLADYQTRIVRIMPSWEESLRRLHNRPQTITDSEAQWVYNTQELLRDYDYTLDNTSLGPEAVAAWLASLPNANNSGPA